MLSVALCQKGREMLGKCPARCDLPLFTLIQYSIYFSKSYVHVMFNNQKMSENKKSAQTQFFANQNRITNPS
jgi:hypothetical protein